ncbi:hypothetical protein [Phormidium sp. CCY1219]|uniref:hypothetical protein n=1 Tax=Phormidium sp. CCY1219 TaxID=2886104 RepID=UPI002D1E853C|nr:hypothetical protein [Phormidium sp. CCY1219]MEB3827099.1 hypothetical protein [Phormidium sp. CCY1219]
MNNQFDVYLNWRKIPPIGMAAIASLLVVWCGAIAQGQGIDCRSSSWVSAYNGRQMNCCISSHYNRMRSQ